MTLQSHLAIMFFLNAKAHFIQGKIELAKYKPLVKK